MKTATNLMFLFFIVFLVTACNKQFDNGELIYQVQTAPNGQSIEDKKVVPAYDEESFEDLWKAYNIDKKRPNINFKKYGVLFANTMESSCPKVISKFEISDNGKKLIIDTSQKGSTCADIGIPKSFVFRIEKHKLIKLQTIEFENKLYNLEH